MEEFFARVQSGMLAVAYEAVEELIDDQIENRGVEIADQLCDWAEADDAPWNDEMLEKASYFFSSIAEQIAARQSKNADEELEEEAE